MVMPLRSQHGVALLTVLLLVVSITVVAGSMLASQKIAIRRSSLLLNQDKLLQAIDAGEQLAMTVIRADNKLNATDSMQDIWAQPLPPFDLGNYSISAELRDEAARFNINNLYYNGAVDSEALAVFQRLLKQLNLAPEIAIAVLDWQDSDNEVYKDGGDEQTVYGRSSSLSNSSLPNQPFVTIKQLAEVRGVNAEVLASLRPFITAVPYYLPINVNTASPVLLASLVDGATSEQLQALTDKRDTQVLATIDDLWQLPPLNALSAEQRQALTPLLAVDSTAFMALMTATDNGSGSTVKQRFATVLISNREVDNAVNSDSNNTNTAAGGDNNSNSNNSNNNNFSNNNLNNSNNANNAKSAKEVKIVSQRLWAFRPSF